MHLVWLILDLVVCTAGCTGGQEVPSGQVDLPWFVVHCARTNCAKVYEVDSEALRACFAPEGTWLPETPVEVVEQCNDAVQTCPIAVLGLEVPMVERCGCQSEAEMGNGCRCCTLPTKMVTDAWDDAGAGLLAALDACAIAATLLPPVCDPLEVCGLVDVDNACGS